jgi:hypothetical protein
MNPESAPLLGAVAQQENVNDGEWPGRRVLLIAARLGAVGVLGVVMVLSIARVAGYADYDGAKMFASPSIAAIKSEQLRQPDVTLRSVDVAHVKTLQINLCVDHQSINTGNLRTECNP